MIWLRKFVSGSVAAMIRDIDLQYEVLLISY